MTVLAAALLAVSLAAGGAWVALAYGGGPGRLAEPGARGVAAWAAAAVAVLAMVGTVVAIVVEEGDARAGGAGADVELTATEERGGELFDRTCASCHALAAAGSSAHVGPNLDLVQPSERRTLRTIERGRVGYTATMPPRLLSGPDAEAVAAYLAKVARRFGDVPGGATRGPAGAPTPARPGGGGGGDDGETETTGGSHRGHGPTGSP